MMTKHKWHKEIKAWADGAEIEVKNSSGNWESFEFEDPYWGDKYAEFRIKSQPKEPQYLYVYKLHNSPEAGFRLDTNYEAPYAKCVGKIKLEQDDE